LDYLPDFDILKFIKNFLNISKEVYFKCINIWTHLLFNIYIS